MAQQDQKTQSIQYKNVNFVPKLRRNRKVELRWGSKYYDAVKTAVFTTQNAPYMPVEPPQSIKEEIDKTGYVCKQCRDCFRFLSSIEEHTARRSWVLGFWCLHCFVTTCTHKVEGKSNCSDCIDVETSKHDYLLSKGIKKNLRKGVTRVFYNQCQFFAHLRMHGMTTVDLSELMLMPLPPGVEQEHYAQLDTALRAVMEIMFIKRIHIMDWIRKKKISWNTLLNSSQKRCDPVADIVSRYSEDCIGATDKSGSSRQDNPIQFEDSQKEAKNMRSQGNFRQLKLPNAQTSRNAVQASSSKVHKVDKKVAPNNIVVVDYGSTPNNRIPALPSEKCPDRSIGFSKKGSNAGDKQLQGVQASKKSLVRDGSLLRSVSLQHNKLKDESWDETPESAEDSTESLSLPSIGRAGPRVLTIRSPRSLSLSTIMKHLPNDGMNRKKIIVVAEDSVSQNGLSKSIKSLEDMGNSSGTLESTVDDKIASLLPITPEANIKTKPFTKPNVTSPTNLLMNHKNKPDTAPNVVSQSFSEQMSLHGKIIFQNGRKYIIKHVPKSKYQSIVQKSSTVTNRSSPASLSSPVSAPKSKCRSIVQESLTETNVNNPAPLLGPIVAPKLKCQSITQDSLMAKKGRNPAPSPRPASEPKRLLMPESKQVLKKLPVGTPVPVTISAPVQKSIVRNQPRKSQKVLPKVTTPTRFTLVPVKKNLPAKNPKSRVVKYQHPFIARIRESMRNELHVTSKKELDMYIENLKEINEAYSKTMGFDSGSVIFCNLKIIQHLEKLLITAPITRIIKRQPDVKADDAFEKAARDWELNMKNSEPLNCEICNKRMKPSTYIIGISAPASDESLFCHCYNNICYLCNTNQGSQIQLKNHIRWHKGGRPHLCPDCSIVFKSAKDLEVHVWTTCFHSMSRHIYGCGVCEVEGFLNMEAVAKHFLLFHTRRKIICAECKTEYGERAPTDAEHALHFSVHHKDILNISEPKRLLLCNLKQCIVRPENFRAHLSDHIGVDMWIYYKCPFCSMVTQCVGRNKSMIREHLMEHHLHRLHEVISPESFSVILKRIQFAPFNSSLTPHTIAINNDKVSQVSNANTSGPMIINARTITSASFEQGTENVQEQLDDLTIPKILDVRSEATDEFEMSDSAENRFNMQIIAVESMAQNVLESPAMKSEASDAMSQGSTSDELTSLSEDNGATVALQIRSSSLKDDVENGSSNSNDDMTGVSRQLINKDSTVVLDFTSSSSKLKINPSFFLQMNDNSQEWNISEKYQNELLTTRETKKTARRPCRIALNSPMSLETAPVTYNCHLCGELINTSWSVIKNHFSSRHARDYELSVVSPQIPQISPRYIEGGYRKDGNLRKRKSEGQVTPGPKRRRRWGPKKYSGKPDSPNLGLCVRPEPVQEVEGSYRCKKCGQHFDEIIMMREHISMTHRIKGQYLICLECGENFVVAPSLQMHLKALHGIQDPISYLSQNTAYAPDILEDTDDEEKTTESNQCYVCMAVFENKAAVDKHIRVHGMAFLKRKRFEAQKAQKYCEKKSETPENNSNIASPNDKLNNAMDSSKLSPNNVKTPDINHDAGLSDDSTKNVRKPLNFLTKKLDSLDSGDTIEKSDDPHNVQNCTSAIEGNANGQFGTTGAS